MKVRKGFTYTLKCGCGDLYVTCNDDDTGKLKEVFLKLGKAGGCSNAVMTSTGMLLSTALKHGTPVKDLIKVLDGTGCHTQPSCISQIALAVRAHEDQKEAIPCTTAV